MKRVFFLIPFLLIVIASIATGAVPPDKFNYQGVLRGVDGFPLSGDFDMEFRLYNALTGGDEILADRHLSANGSPVTVVKGLFNVAIGSGLVEDGAGPGTYTALAPVFGDYGDVWLEVTVGSEVLSPRINVISAPFALNAARLEGLGAADFAPAAHPHDGADIVTGTVAEAFIDPVVARDSEIMPTVLAGDGPGSLLDSDMVDGLHAADLALAGHSHDSAYQTQLVRTVIVSPVPGDPVAGGQALLDAVAGITDAAPDNPWLVKVEPGVFDLNGGMLALKPWLDLEGSGEGVTFITSAAGCALVGCGGTLIGVDNSEIRFLSVENTGGDTRSHAISAVDTSPSIRHVDALATGAIGLPSGAASGITLSGNSAATLKDVVARGEGERWGFGVEVLRDAWPILENVEAAGVATGGSVPPQGGIGLAASEANITIRNSVLTGSGGAFAMGLDLTSNGVGSWTARVENTAMVCTVNTIAIGRYFDARVAVSRLDGGPVTAVPPESTLTCAGVYDENFVFYPDTCP